MTDIGTPIALIASIAGIGLGGFRRQFAAAGAFAIYSMVFAAKLFLPGQISEDVLAAASIAASLLLIAEVVVLIRRRSRANGPNRV